MIKAFQHFGSLNLNGFFVVDCCDGAYCQLKGESLGVCKDNDKQQDIYEKMTRPKKPAPVSSTGAAIPAPTVAPVVSGAVPETPATTGTTTLSSDSSATTSSGAAGSAETTSAAPAAGETTSTGSEAATTPVAGETAAKTATASSAARRQEAIYNTPNEPYDMNIFRAVSQPSDKNPAEASVKYERMNKPIQNQAVGFKNEAPQLVHSNELLLTSSKIDEKLSQKGFLPETLSTTIDPGSELAKRSASRYVSKFSGPLMKRFQNMISTVNKRVAQIPKVNAEKMEAHERNKTNRVYGLDELTPSSN